MNILFCTSEAVPFAASGGLGDVAGSLPKAIRNRRVACRVVMPLYSDMKQEYKDKLQYITNFTVPVGWRSQYCGVFSYSHNGVIHYFLDNEYYFKRNGIYGFYDDAERYAFFSRAVLELLFHIDFEPNILHCNDWQTALVPVYLNLFYRHLREYSQIKSVFTIHNIQYQGKYGKELLEEILSVDKNDAHVLEYDKCVNFMKGAIVCADKVTTVSPTYAKEILDPWFSHELDGLLWEKQYKLCGILNGIDTVGYNPEKDTSIAKNYTVSSVANGKAACKKELLKHFGLKDEKKPLVGMVTRLVGHKGLDLVRHSMQEMVDNGIQFVMLGSGEESYEDFFRDFAAQNPDNVGVQIDFVPSLARQIYAGADMFLMPSKSEPCGLSQLISLRYGTIPIVRETGGLKDSIKDSGDGLGNGFTFAQYTPADMLYAVLRAKEGYENKKGWTQLVKRAMQCDFSWGTSAKAYVALYKEVVELW